MFRLIIKCTALVLLLLGIVTNTIAQRETRDEAAYRKTSARLRKEIWNWNLPQFANRTVPPQYAKASSVVLARYVDLDASSKIRAFDGSGILKELSVTEVTRDLVKLNDAAAVKEYSEMSFTKLRKDQGYGAARVNSTYIGVRVIKEGGAAKDIDVDDVVLTKDEKEEKQAKLAIPDLQIGDMIDYYVANETKEPRLQYSSSWSFYFSFFDRVPVVNYALHCELSPKYAAEYKRYNGAPKATLTTDEDGTNIIDATATNLEVYPAGLFWDSPYRQSPFMQLNLIVNLKGIAMVQVNKRETGHVYDDQSSDNIVWDEIISIGKKAGAVKSIPQLVKKSAAIKDAYKELRERADELPRDSVAAALYYMFRYDLLFNVGTDINVPAFVNISERSFSPSAYSYLLMEYFNENDLDAELLLTTSRYRPKLADVFSTDDIGYLVYVPKAKKPIFGATDFYSCAFHIPASYENAKQAIALNTRSIRSRGYLNAARHFVDIPDSNPADNLHIEHLTIDPDLSGDAVKVVRNTTLTGHYKDETQKKLLLLEDFYNYERTFYKEDQTLIEKYAEKRKSRKLSEELEAAFAEARKKQKDAFKDDAKEFFDQEVSELTDQKILNPGVRHTSPEFRYSSRFNLKGIIKRAGNNYLIEVGKLLGSQVKIDDDQRERKFDIYQPFARTLQVEIRITIPDGYVSEGVESISRSASNESASFVVKAKTEGNTIIILTEKTYKNAVDPASAWPRLMAVLDTAYDWNNAKVLLKKK